MPRSALKTVERNFVKGRLSEFTGLNFPENSCVDESNCVFDSRGYVSRRPGLQREPSGNAFNTLTSSGAASKFVWKNAGQTANTTFMVVQHGSEVGFFQVNAVGCAESLAYTLDLTDYATSADVGLKVCSYAQGDGYLFVSNPLMEPVYVDYDESGTFTVAQIDVQIRDTDGLRDDVMDPLPPDTRPASLTNTHRYNLYNQGWWERDVFGHNGSLYTPIEGWDRYNSNWPSNADIWWSFRFLAGNPTNKEEYVPNASVMGLTEPRSNGPAPRGHYILSAFNQDRSGVSGISGLEALSSGAARPGIIAFFAGRVWYAGVNAPGFGQTVYFSKIIEGKKDYGKCYQVNDPTIEEGTDLLDSDGGTVRILEMGIPVAFFNLRDSLLIFCNNGIWAISGSTGTGFKATDYSVQKISGVGALSSLSIVNVEGSPIWWNADGIYALVASPQGTFEAQSMTKPSIQSFYNDEIETAAKRYAMGDYNPIEKRAIWLYGTGDFIQPIPDTSDVTVSVSGAFDYEHALVLDVATGAFYTWSFDTVIAQLRGILCLDAQGANEQSEDVTVSGVTVTVSGADVTMNVIVVLDTSSVFKYMTDHAGDFLFCEMTNIDSWVDWEDLNIPDGGFDYESYFTTAYKVHADGDKSFNAHWVTVFTEKYPGGDGDDSAFLQAKWDWTTHSSEGRWSVEQQVYPPDVSNRSTYHRRLKMRGSGPCLQLHFRGESGKPFRISGWSTMETAADSVSR